MHSRFVYRNQRNDCESPDRYVGHYMTSEVFDPTDTEAKEREQYLAFVCRVEGTNINPQTLLATDYLNHFNEIVMLLEMIPDMPDCLDEAKAWRPTSYQDHFRESQFHDKELAVEAYDHVPRHYREAFDETIEQMIVVVAMSLGRIVRAVANREAGPLRMVCSDSSRSLQKMIDVASAIIHGSSRRLDQAEIDGFLAGLCPIV